MKNLALALVPALLISGCNVLQTQPPQSLAVSGAPFTIELPKDLNYSQGDGWGLDFYSFKNKNFSGTIQHFFSVEFDAEQELNALSTNICRGEIMESGSTFQSCVKYTADINMQTFADSVKLTITPKEKTVAQGRNAIFIPISLPEIDLEDWYGYLSSQKITTSKIKVTSPYPSESVKGNFDRMLSQHKWGSGQADAAHRQFQNTYKITVNADTDVLVSAGFYPYRDGSIVEYVITGVSGNNKNLRTINWNLTLKEVKAKIASVIQG
jgi:hypothetical protein